MTDVESDFEIDQLYGPHAVDLEKSTEKDELTGLLNRSGFEKQLSRLLESAISGKLEHAFLYIDLDLFQIVNDVHGHNAGDQLLCGIADVLKQYLRHNDFLARLGGDEFGVLFSSCDIENARNVAELLRVAIRNFQGKLSSDVHRISASIGVVIINCETQSISELLREVDVACYTAKGLGRDRVQVYQTNDKMISLKNDDMQWCSRINSALDNDGYCLYAQPIVPLGLGADAEIPLACEILLRMENEDGSIVSPAEFIPTAVRYGLATRLDRWVVKAVLNYLDSHLEAASRLSLLTINLSGQSVCDKDFLEFLVTKLASVQFSTAILCFEITETEAIENTEEALFFINKIKRDFGCLFALDDFGSGFSSYKYMKELPIDIVKVDGEFIRDMMVDPASKILIQSLTNIAQISNIQTVAEWIETPEMLAEVETMGIDYGQGFYLGGPMPVETYIEQQKKILSLISDE